MADSILARTLNLNAVIRLSADAKAVEDAAQIGAEIAKATYEALKSKNLGDLVTENIQGRVDPTTGKPYSNVNTDSEKKTEATNKMRAGAVKGLQTAAQSGVSILKSTLGIITDVYAKIKQASPLLNAVETLFNLAMQLFFMPLGTKLATELLPGVKKLIDNVMQIWDGFENKSLTDIFKETIHLGAKIFGEYFKEIGSKLGASGGILGTIGTVLHGLGNFITRHGESLLNKIVWLTSFFLRHIPELIGLIVTFKAVSTVLQIQQIYATYAAAAANGGHTPWGAVVATTAIGAGTSGLAYALSKYNLNDTDTAADGGYFPATPGGTNVLIAEGGEGETVVPDSKKVDFAKSIMANYASAAKNTAHEKTQNVTLNIYVNGYTDTDLSDKIVRVINEQTNLSRLRSGF